MTRPWPERPRVLLSYAYLRGAPLPPGLDIIIDSGAFTVHTTGRAIDRDEYTRFLAEQVGRFTFAFSLDVLHDPAVTWRNYAAQRDQLAGSGVVLVPTWHVSSPLTELERLCESASYVSIGGMVGIHTSRLLRLSVAAHQVAARHGTKLHGLGVTATTVLRAPWASVDSSSWTMARRKPLIYLCRQGGRIRAINRGQTLSKSDTTLIEQYGLSSRAVSNPWASRGPNKALLLDSYTVAMCRSFMEMERWGHHPRVYLASTLTDVPIITRAHRLGSIFQYATNGATP